MSHTALIIDDEPDIRELIAMSLGRIGLDTHTAANLDEARNLLDAYEFDVCLSDMKLPDGNGIEFVKYIQQVQPQLPVAVITAHGNMDAAVEAMKNGAFDFVSKPVDLGLLRKLVMQAIDSRSEASNNASHSDQPVATNSKPKSAKSSTSVEDNSLSATITSEDEKTTTFNVAGDKEHNSTLETEHELETDLNSLEVLSGRSVPTEQSFTLLGDENLIGDSAPMLELRRMIAKVAKTNAPIWITGESGTGKELIANLIHANSARAAAPFVAINCGAIPSELMESELFGHRKGSFTGAHSDHDGLFKKADGGTLFLDEVAELPLHMQVKLLRAIQERRVRPVGAAEEISTDVRILSACHKDLADEVDQGRFRHDLYYRLNVISIASPRLCDRDGDITQIAKAIVKTICAKEGLNRIVTLDDSAIESLNSYRFPGNVRELENILERAVALCDQSILSSVDLNLGNDKLTQNIQAENTQLYKERNTASTDIGHRMNDRERIVKSLHNNRWNRKAAAEELGITYRQLRYRIKQLGIDEQGS